MKITDLKRWMDVKTKLFPGIFASVVLGLASTSLPSEATHLFIGTAGPPEVEVSVGERIVLIPGGRDNLHHVPDEPISILSENPLKYLLTGGQGTRLMSGTTFADSKPNALVLRPTGKDGDPDRDYAGICSIHLSSNNILGFYHAEDHQGIEKNSKGSGAGFYASICLAESGRNDIQFVRRGQIITSHKPKMERGWEIEGGPRESWSAQGAGDPTVCLDATKQYFYCYYNELGERRQRGVQLCMARCLVADRGQPGKWQKLFQGGFVEPGLTGRDTPIFSAVRAHDCVMPHAQYVPAWARYILVFGVLSAKEYHAEDGQPERSGLYIATSPDGIRWREPKQILKTFCIFHMGRETNVHPTLMLQQIAPKVASGVLICGYTPKWPVPHFMVSYPITLKAARDDYVERSGKIGKPENSQ